ncbi:MAG: radical SAM protein [Lachnospiraceae bacterium]
MIRYSVITQKNPREIVMLRGNGCKWRRCRFCDYHLDYSKDTESNYELNKEQLAKVTGLYHKLEIINSGSFTDLDEKTLTLIEQICLEKEISELHFECHWMHREEVPTFRERFQRLGITLKLKIGVETFDSLFRESYLDKGITTDDPDEIASYFDEVCLLFGLPGQSVSSMRNDIETGLRYFERVCVNIMTQNQMPIQPDDRVIALFKTEIYPDYVQNDRVDILMENTDFGVGGNEG